MFNFSLQKDGGDRMISGQSNFDERRTAQAAAFLLHRAGGRLPSLKLMKLLYLAERKSFDVYGVPITGDKLMSLPYGPVLSMTLNHINGAVVSKSGGWDTWVADKAQHVVALADPSMISNPAEDLLALSESDVEVLDAIWTEFGKWDRWDLVEYTHTSLAEWTDPEGSSLPITYERLFSALGRSEGQIEAMVARLSEQAHISAALAG